MSTAAAIHETCYTCGKSIEDFEKPYIWQDSIVCDVCHERLSEQFIAMAINSPVARAEQPDNGAFATGIMISLLATLAAGGGALAWWALG